MLPVAIFVPWQPFALAPAQFCSNFSEGHCHKPFTRQRRALSTSPDAFPNERTALSIFQQSDDQEVPGPSLARQPIVLTRRYHLTNLLAACAYLQTDQCKKVSERAAPLTISPGLEEPSCLEAEWGLSNGSPASSEETPPRTVKARRRLGLRRKSFNR